MKQAYNSAMEKEKTALEYKQAMFEVGLRRGLSRNDALTFAHTEAAKQRQIFADEERKRREASIEKRRATWAAKKAAQEAERKQNPGVN